LTLVGELAVPEQADPVATLVTLHPLPTQGGYMDSHVLRKAAWRLPHLADLAVVRFNTRGTKSPRGRSQGFFEGGQGERHDVVAALDFVESRGLPDPWLVGWSFGTELALMYGRDPRVTGAVLLSPPLARATDGDLDAWSAFGRDLVVLVPEHDDFLRPGEAKARFGRVPQAELIGVVGANHLWVGETAVRRVLNEIVRHVRPEIPRLPTRWTPPTEGPR
ncbi:MAG: alpha/beta fold hydrolase, partial [Micrococcales bacterium]|nr:alpha/beta fold hydrolase [Micrococcales bacterium]